MTGPPPRSPLFPYTTLFRSPQRHTRRPFVQGPQTAVVTGKSGEEIWTDKYGRVKVKFFWDREGSKDEDRKSTRLNSSHMSISYAVFCLKKKKNKQECRTRIS